MSIIFSKTLKKSLIISNVMVLISWDDTGKGKWENIIVIILYYLGTNSACYVALFII